MLQGAIAAWLEILLEKGSYNVRLQAVKIGNRWRDKAGGFPNGGAVRMENEEAVKNDFNEIAGLPAPPRWNHNNCYFGYLMQFLPECFERRL